jgi:hypothetical protein
MERIRMIRAPRAQALRVRELLAFALLACACGVATRAAKPGAPKSQTAVVTPRSSEASALDAGGAFQAIEAQWSAFVPGMRAVATLEGGVEKLQLARADERDTCMRVAFEASEPVVASLLDAASATLATSSPERTRGLLAEHGPVCVRKGDAIYAQATGPATARVRWVAWASR